MGQIPFNLLYCRLVTIEKNLKGIMWNPILFLLLIFTEGNYENEVSTQKPLTPGGSGLLTRHVFQFFDLKKT